MVPIETGRDFEGHFEVVDGLFPLTLGTIYIAKDKMSSAGLKFLSFLWKEFDGAVGGVFCGIELSVRTQQSGKVI